MKIVVRIVIAIIFATVSSSAHAQRAGAARPIETPLKPLPPDQAYAGEIRAFAGEKCPPNWLPADGTEYPEKDHKGLLAAIGDLWGATTISTFKVPDLRGVFLRGIQTLVKA